VELGEPAPIDPDRHLERAHPAPEAALRGEALGAHEVGARGQRYGCRPGAVHRVIGHLGQLAAFGVEQGVGAVLQARGAGAVVVRGVRGVGLGVDQQGAAFTRDG
jgi:hypothetical protein